MPTGPTGRATRAHRRTSPAARRLQNAYPIPQGQRFLSGSKLWSQATGGQTSILRRCSLRDCSSSKCVANYFCSANPRTNRCAVSLDRYWGCWTRERPSLSGQLHFLIWHGQWFVLHAGPDDAPRMEIVSKDQRDGGLPIRIPSLAGGRLGEELIQQVLEGLFARPPGRRGGVEIDRRLLDGVDISGPVNLPPPCLWSRCPVLHHDRIVSALIIQIVHWRIMCSDVDRFLVR